MARSFPIRLVPRPDGREGRVVISSATSSFRDVRSGAAPSAFPFARVVLPGKTSLQKQKSDHGKLGLDILLQPSIRPPKRAISSRAHCFRPGRTIRQNYEGTNAERYLCLGLGKLRSPRRDPSARARPGPLRRSQETPRTRSTGLQSPRTWWNLARESAPARAGRFRRPQLTEPHTTPIAPCIKHAVWQCPLPPPNGPGSPCWGCSNILSLFDLTKFPR